MNEHDGPAATITIGNVEHDAKAVFAAITAPIFHQEMERRGLCACFNDEVGVVGLTERDFDHFRALLLRRAIPDALWELENRLRDHDVLCGGFADDVAAYFSRKA